MSYSGSYFMFQSTLPAWGATCLRNTSAAWLTVSIHAPRVGSDLGRDGFAGEVLLFKSTLPAWGATAASEKSPAKGLLFQSTLPAWGATITML